MRPPETGTRIVGLGGAAGDDAIGLEVVEALRRTGVGPGIELHTITDPVQLMPLLEGRGTIVLVDAVLQVPAGRVLDLTPADLARLPAPASSHGLSPVLAIELARQLGPEPGPPVAIVAVTIAAPPAGRIGLSPAVARAIPLAVEHVLAAVARPLRPRPA